MNEKNAHFQRPEIPGNKQFLYLVLLTIGGFVLTIIISLMIFWAHFGLNDLQNLNMRSVPWSITTYLMLVQDVCMFGVPAWILAMIVKRRADYFYIHVHSAWQLWVLVIIIAFAALFVTDLLGQLNEWIPIPKTWASYFKQMENNYNQDAIAVINFKTFGTFIVSLLTIALLPAIFEELFFRGALQQVMVKWTGKAIPGIIISSIIFSAFHLSYYGFLPRLMLGIVLGVVYYYGKNIKLNMLIHFINNAVVVIALYISNKGKPLTASALNSDNSQLSPWYLQVFSVIVLIVLLRLFIRKTQTTTTDSPS